MEAEAVGNMPLRLVFSNHKSAGKRKKKAAIGEGMEKHHLPDITSWTLTCRLSATIPGKKIMYSKLKYTRRN